MSPGPGAPQSDELSELLARSEAAIARMRKREEHLAHGISHDLRAPLRAITGYAQVLVNQYEGALDAQARDYLGRIHDAAGRMEGLIEKLLQLSYVDRAPLRLERVDLGMLAEWSLAELQDLQPGPQADIDVQSDLWVQGDERQLKQLMDRLLHNAWTFSRSRDDIRIGVRGHREGGRLLVAVEDTGSGFDMRYADRVFVPFQRLHGSEQGGGDGLGLAIAQAIVERHDGRIWAESTPGVGSVFHIDLPAAHDSEDDDAHD
ncbi:sensor histidine kinase [Luteimonas yindakuii]|nr:ATP-binding protein [Luteimonas yindakuii]